MRRLWQCVLHMVIAGEDRRQDNRHQLAARKCLDAIPNNAEENTENDWHIRSPHSKHGARVNREANVPDSTGPSNTEHHGRLEEFRNDVAENGLPDIQTKSQERGSDLPAECGEEDGAP